MQQKLFMQLLFDNNFQKSKKTFSFSLINLSLQSFKKGGKNRGEILFI